MDITVLEVTMGTASMMAHFHQDLLFVWKVSSLDLMSYLHKHNATVCIYVCINNSMYNIGI